MVDDYGYINARIRALKGKLLTREDYDELLRQTSLDGIIAFLKGTVYGEELSKALVTESGLPAITRALRLNFQNVMQKILHFSAGEPHELFSVVLGRWDVYNLLTILRGKMHGVSDRDIQDALIPAGMLDETRLAELVRQPDASSVVDLVATWGVLMPVPVGRALTRLVREGRVQEMEYFLESQYFQWAFNRVQGGGENRALVRQALQTLVDIKNIIAALILIREGIKPLGRVRFLEGGTLSRSVLKDLEQAENPEEAFRVLERSPYGHVIRERAIRDIPTLERFLEKTQINRLVALKKQDPLGIGLGLSYIWAKYSEVVNLRTIAHGIYYSVPRPDLLETLVLPV